MYEWAIDLGQGTFIEGEAVGRGLDAVKEYLPGETDEVVKLLDCFEGNNPPPEVVVYRLWGS